MLIDKPNTCPLELLLSQISGPWTLYLLWILDTNGSLRFGELRRKVPGISTKVLTDRLRLLESMDMIHRHYEPTVPPQVTYTLTELGKELGGSLGELYTFAMRWHKEEERTSPFH